MKKFIKPLAFLFAIAVTTGAYAQQDKPARPIKAQMKAKHLPAKKVDQSKHYTKSILVPNRDKDIQRIVREKGITVAQVK